MPEDVPYAAVAHVCAHSYLSKDVVDEAFSRNASKNFVDEAHGEQLQGFLTQDSQNGDGKVGRGF